MSVSDTRESLTLTFSNPIKENKELLTDVYSVKKKK